jgi:hypothetical protein
MRFPHLAHRSAAAHKLHSTPQQDSMNLISGNRETSSRLPAFSLFLPGSCPNNRNRCIDQSSVSLNLDVEELDLAFREGSRSEPIGTPPIGNFRTVITIG